MWQSVPKTYDSQAGETYRIKVGLRSSYDVATVNKIIGALQTGAGLVDTAPFTAMTGYWLLSNFETDSEGHPDFVPFQGGPYEPWTLTFQGERINGGTPLVAVVGYILAVLIVFGTVVVVTGWTVDKLVQDTTRTPIGQGVSDALQAFPALIVGGFIIALLFLLPRKG